MVRGACSTVGGALAKAMTGAYTAPDSGASRIPEATPASRSLTLPQSSSCR